MTSKKKKKKVATVDLGLPPPKTAREMVLDSLVEALLDRWHEYSGPYNAPEQYQNEFEQFCEDQIYYAMKRGALVFEEHEKGKFYAYGKE